jgi:heme-degrading monooxygenase HmoA
MTKVGQPYTSGNWVVKAGSEDEFISRWTDFVQWAHDNASGAQNFMLIRDVSDPRHFVSFGAWDDSESVAAWRSGEEFARRLAVCRELCDDFSTTDSTLAAAVGA